MKTILKTTLGALTTEKDASGLCAIYTEREEFCKKLRLLGKTAEEIEEALQKEDFQERIDAICYPKGKKEEKKIKLNTWYPEFVLLDAIRPVIEGKNIYKRFLIQKLFEWRFVNEGGGIYADIRLNPEIEEAQITPQMVEYLNEMAAHLEY